MSISDAVLLYAVCASAYLSVCSCLLLFIYYFRNIDEIKYRQPCLIFVTNVYMIILGLAEFTNLIFDELELRYALNYCRFLCLFPICALNILQTFRFTYLLKTRCTLTVDNANNFAYLEPNRIICFTPTKIIPKAPSSTMQRKTSSESHFSTYVSPFVAIKSRNIDKPDKTYNYKAIEFSSYKYSRICIFVICCTVASMVVLYGVSLIADNYSFYWDEVLNNFIYGFCLVCTVFQGLYFFRSRKLKNVLYSKQEIFAEVFISIVLLVFLLAYQNTILRFCFVINLQIWKLIYSLVLVIKHKLFLNSLLHEYFSFLRCWTNHNYRPALGRIALNRYCFELFEFVEEYEAIASQKDVKQMAIFKEKYLSKGSYLELNVSEKSKLNLTENSNIQGIFDEVMLMLYDNVYSTFLTQNKV
eukprot:NODE_898_length_3216_cov_0.643247.p1 type:complete len:415 gc:universal NODE_898_length_3216_cov_0.643247:3113-1869(-)